MTSTYPVLSLRVVAMFIDSTILAILFFALVALSSTIGISNTAIRLAFIVLPVILFEPFLIWITGGNIGHHYSGIRVVGKNTDKNLFVLNGVVRFITKTLLGLFSLASMVLTKRHQSIHDVVSHSVVVFKDEAAAPSRHKLRQRDSVYTSHKPSIGRRLIVVLAYIVIAILITSFALNFLVAAKCLNSSVCTDAENTMLGLGGGAFIITSLIVLVLGFLCKLPGAYYRAPGKD